ncbi:Zinc finger HIT-type [Penicillium citrinum]|uniref:Box C/D snoRNA protein 1 n=1 Tax=Penicillium citrinum TaxID=5077 RepID=A0A9W9TVX4_PENCI|nr:Zinc finger HIT-type [Penicillium citrinum]KAJ5242694.1 Zinc finger HIT-type [Penicillium citrinum]
MDNPDPLLSELCSICHINPPKYRCPRCSTRTCSLPCTRRHKLWSQCSGVRDPGAYLKRSELATPAAFDRDFNFISGIERSLERAERDAENRGIELGSATAEQDAEAGAETEQGRVSAAGQKRKHPGQGLVKGEAGFLRGAEAGGVKVVRAPRGMSRNKANGSRWHPKHKCLSWSIEWISPSGEKFVKNCLETGILCEAYNRAFPLPKEERPVSKSAEEHDDQKKDNRSSLGQSNIPPSNDTTTTTDIAKEQPAQSSTSDLAETSTEKPEENEPNLPIVPYRDVYFYLHRPRTTSKKPVLVPISPSATLGSILRGRTVLEFPTIFTLSECAEKLIGENGESRFILEEEYLRTADPAELGDKSPGQDLLETGNDEDTESGLQNLDEKKVLEVLKQDLYEPVPDGEP